MARLGLFSKVLQQSTLFDDTLVVDGLLDPELNGPSQVAGSVSHLADALLRGASSLSHGTNALVYAAVTRSHATDCLLKASPTKAHQADALLKATRQATHGTDADLKKTLTLAHGADSYLVAPLVFTGKAHLADALLKASVSRSYGTDTRLKATRALAHGTDAQLSAQGATDLSHTSSSMLEATVDRAHGTSSWLRLVLYRKGVVPSDTSSVVPSPAGELASIPSTPQIATGTGQVQDPQASSGTTGAPASGTIVGDTEQSGQAGQPTGSSG